MVHWLKAFWSGSEPVTFESAYGMDESVERLKAATRRWAFSVMAQQTAVGRVTESRVALQRVIPMVHNSFKPFFVGRFQRNGSKIVLTGRFAVNGFVRVFMAFWLGCCLLFATLGLFMVFRSPQSLPLPLVGMAMFAAGLGLLRFGGWFSRNDPGWLSDVIRNALGAPSTTPSVTSAPGRAVASTNARAPIVILLVAAFILLNGLGGLISAISGIQSFQASPAGSVTTYYTSAGLRYAAAIVGITLVALAWGIYRRRLLAWHLGFVVLALGVGGSSIFAMLSNPLLRTVPLGLTLLFSAMIVLITLIWGRWWYAQRTHFRD